MYNHLQLAAKYLYYYLTASNGKGHGMHSPFVFDFITKILNDKNDYEDYKIAETLRHQLKSDHTILHIDEMGAGSSISKTNQRTIASITKNAVKSKKYSQLLYRMVTYYQPSTILELGTSLGITTSYLSLAKPGACLITLEGAEQVAAIAKKNFDTLGLKNISIINGNFDDTLVTAITRLSGINFAFIDGNHRREPTERYFHQLLPHLNNDSILIFDDIHWSKEMEQAWHHIKNDPAVRCSLDLFFIGIVFFRREFTEKQHFSIRF